MAKNKKNDFVDNDELVEDTLSVEQEAEFIEEAKLVEEVKVPEEPKVSRLDAKAAKKSASEVIFLAPYSRQLPVMNGIFVEVIGVHAVFEAEGGAKYAVPYNEQAHKHLKAGDEFSF